MTTKRKQSLNAQRANIFMVDPDDLYMEETPGKKHYDPRVHYAFQERVVNGMLEFGVKESILVEKCGDKISVVDGRQRVTNAREAKRRQLESGAEKTVLVPCKVERGDEIKLFKIGVITNEHRTAENCVTQAHKIQQYLDKGFSEEEAAEFWDVTVKTIQNRLKILELSPAVQTAIVEEKITVTRALKLCNLSYEQQEKSLEDKPATKKAPSKWCKPKKASVQAAVSANGDVHDAAKAAILWVRGEISEDEACARIKGLRKVLGELR